jgi:alpha-mannosidase
VCGLEDIGDRGDTYDFDPVPWSIDELRPPRVNRATHVSGLQHLRVSRSLIVPRLADLRDRVDGPGGSCDITIVARVAPGVRRVDLAVHVDNQATDHRLRMLFPTGASVERFQAATTFDVAERSTAARDGAGWLHPAPRTFPHQGWVSANGLIVLAPGLTEAEVTSDGTIAITLLRSVGWLSRMDLKTRPSHAGPALPTPGAQCLRSFSAALSLMPGIDARETRGTELGFIAVAAGEEPMLAPDESLVEIADEGLVLTTLKPAGDSDGMVLRVLNPSDVEREAVVRLGFDVATARAVRLDETPSEHGVTLAGRELRFVVPAHALRSVLIA